MKVKELVAYLQTLDQEAECYFANDYWMSAADVGPFDTDGPTEVPYSYGDNGGVNRVGYYWSI